MKWLLCKPHRFKTRCTSTVNGAHLAIRKETAAQIEIEIIHINKTLAQAQIYNGQTV